jgi:hypothetical protein
VQNGLQTPNGQEDSATSKNVVTPSYTLKVCSDAETKQFAL